MPFSPYLVPNENLYHAHAGLKSLLLVVGCVIAQETVANWHSAETPSQHQSFDSDVFHASFYFFLLLLLGDLCLVGCERRPFIYMTLSVKNRMLLRWKVRYLRGRILSDSFFS